MKLAKKLAEKRGPAGSEHRPAASDESLGAESGADGGMGFTSSYRPNIFGGYDEYRNGTMVGTSKPNIFGGFDRSTMGIHGETANVALVDTLIEGAHDLAGALVPDTDPDDR